MPKQDIGLVAPRPTFARAPTDESFIQMKTRQSLRRSDSSFAESVASEAALDVPLIHTGRPPGHIMHRVLGALTPPRRVAEPLGHALSAAAPYVKDGLTVAAGIGMVVWLGVLTGKLRELEDVPMCMTN